MDLAEKARVGILLDAQAESFRRGLQEVAVAGRALRVQLEVLYPPVVQDDDLDVLPAHVHDHVRIVVKLERRLGVGHGLDQRYVCMQNIFQDVLGIAGRGYAQHFEFGALRFHLSAQVFKHFDGVLNRIAVRKLVGLAQDGAVFIEQHRLGRRGTSVNADEASDCAAFLKSCRREFLTAIGFLEDRKVLRLLHQSLAARFRLLLLPAKFDVLN